MKRNVEEKHQCCVVRVVIVFKKEMKRKRFYDNLLKHLFMIYKSVRSKKFENCDIKAVYLKNKIF